MSENDKYNVHNLMTNIVNQQPIESTLAFNELMIDKLNTYINDRKMEIAQTMFNGGTQDPTEVETNGETA